MSIELKNFIDLNDIEKKIVLNFRNDSSIRKWMYTSDIILIENHLKFIENLKENKSNIYFLIKEDNQNIGVIYFNNIANNRCDIGLYSNPEFKGMGNRLMQIICDKAFFHLNINVLNVDVFAKNKKAIKLYKQFNFQEIDSKLINEEKILLMELKNENR